MRRNYLLAWWSQLLIIALCAGAGQAAPQPTTAPAPQKTAATLTPEAIQQKIADLEQKIKASQAAATPQTARQLGVDLALLQKRTGLLQDLREKNTWLLENLTREGGLKNEKADLLKNLAVHKERGVTAPPPYSLSFYEDLLSQLQFFEQREEACILSSSLARAYVAANDKEVEAAGKKVRLLQDQLAAATLPEAKRKLSLELEIARLKRELAETTYLSAGSYGRIFQTLQEMAASQVAVYREQAAWVQKHLHAQDADFDAPVLLLEKRHSKVAATRAKLQHEIHTWDKKWEAAHKAADQTGAPLPAEIAQERQTLQHTYRSILDAQMHHLTLLRSAETLWQHRRSLLTDQVTQKQLLAWKEDLDQKKETGKKYLTYLGGQNVVLQAQIAALDKRLAEPGLDPRLKEVLTEHNMSYSLLIQEIKAIIQTLNDSDQLASRLSREIDGKITQDPWSAFWTRIKMSLERFLNFEIWTIEEQAVTVKKLLEALAFLAVGLLLTKSVLHYLLFPLLARTVWKQSKAEILEKAVTYLAYTLVFLITLGKLRLPLQSFATLGGGVAIGLGFAAQTIIKNFVSGFIILGEKPFGLGDLVEVGGILGNVNDIGSRSTLLRTGENKDLLVPNSFFLENTITNWTRRDRRVRAQVTVGVAYGSPVAKVKDLLLQAIDECDQILKSPHPFVIFNDFGDNALIFNTYFWIEITGVMGRQIVQSDLRFKINELFRAADITIAFPQRDVHLDGPLKVHLVDKDS